MDMTLKAEHICVAFILAVTFILFGGLFADAMAQSGIDFSKGDTVGNGFITWLKKNPVVWFFTAALIFVGIAAALNRAPWMWLVYILVGAFIAFGASKMVTFFAKQFA